MTSTWPCHVIRARRVQYAGLHRMTLATATGALVMSSRARRTSPSTTITPPARSGGSSVATATERSVSWPTTRRCFGSSPNTSTPVASGGSHFHRRRSVASVTPKLWVGDERIVEAGDQRRAGPGRKSTLTCSVPDCKFPHFGHGWCKSHYLRWKRWGDPLLRQEVSAAQHRIAVRRALPPETRDAQRWKPQRRHLWRHPCPLTRTGSKQPAFPCASVSVTYSSASLCAP